MKNWVKMIAEKTCNQECPCSQFFIFSLSRFCRPRYWYWWQVTRRNTFRKAEIMALHWHDGRIKLSVEDASRQKKLAANLNWISRITATCSDPERTWENILVTIGALGGFHQTCMFFSIFAHASVSPLFPFWVSLYAPALLKFEAIDLE